MKEEKNFLLLFIISISIFVFSYILNFYWRNSSVSLTFSLLANQSLIKEDKSDWLKSEKISKIKQTKKSQSSSPRSRWTKPTNQPITHPSKYNRFFIVVKKVFFCVFFFWENKDCNFSHMQKKKKNHRLCLDLSMLFHFFIVFII